MKGSKSINFTQPSYTPEEQEINEQFLEATLDDDLDLVKELLKNPKLDVNVRAEDNNLLTGLHTAIVNGNPDMVKAILDHPNVDINAEDEFGNTPLSCANF